MCVCPLKMLSLDRGWDIESGLGLAHTGPI